MEEQNKDQSKENEEKSDKDSNPLEISSLLDLTDKSEDHKEENEEKSDNDKDSQTIPIPQDLTNKIPGVTPILEPQKKPVGPDLPFTTTWDNKKPINPKKV